MNFESDMVIGGKIVVNDKQSTWETEVSLNRIETEKGMESNLDTINSVSSNETNSLSTELLVDNGSLNFNFGLSLTA